MIKNKSRAHWFGASDTATIMGNWDTETFKNWWFVKMGYQENTYHSWEMDCGNIMEIPIIRAIEESTGQRIKLGKHPYYNLRFRVRVNYDGLKRDSVVEIKTTRNGMLKVPMGYWQQCQVEMWNKRKRKAELYAYFMEDFDYLCPYFTKIDMNRIRKFDIEYDAKFINDQYLPRVKYLAHCLRKKKFPKLGEI